MRLTVYWHGHEVGGLHGISEDLVPALDGLAQMTGEGTEGLLLNGPFEDHKKEASPRWEYHPSWVSDRPWLEE